MEKVKNNLALIINLVTLITCLCSITYGWGVINTQVLESKKQIDKLEQSIVTINQNMSTLLLKIGMLEGKIDAVINK